MLLSYYVIDFVGGTLVHSRALSKGYQMQSSMNQAALFFALYNYSGSIYHSQVNQGLKFFETTYERFVFEPISDKQWLIVITTSRAMDVNDTRYLARAMGSGNLYPMDRRRQIEYFQCVVPEALESTLNHILNTLCEQLKLELLLVALPQRLPQEQSTPINLLRSQSRWRRRIQLLFQRLSFQRRVQSLLETTWIFKSQGNVRIQSLMESTLNTLISGLIRVAKCHNEFITTADIARHNIAIISNVNFHIVAWRENTQVCEVVHEVGSKLKPIIDAIIYLQK